MFSIDILNRKSPDLSWSFQISRITNALCSCDPTCQIRKLSSLFGPLGHKQSRRWDFWTCQNFSNRHLKRSFVSFWKTLPKNVNSTEISRYSLILGHSRIWDLHVKYTFLDIFPTTQLRTVTYFMILQLQHHIWLPGQTDAVKET